MLCDIVAHIPAAMMGVDHQDEQHLESLSWHNEVIDGNHVPHMGVQKILPRRRGCELATPFGIAVLKDAGSIPSLGNW